MTYTIIYNGNVFQRDNFDERDSYRTGMVVINNLNNTYTSNGIDWHEIIR